MRHSVEMLRQEFVEKFGREPGPNDPLLFDPGKEVPTRLPRGEIAKKIIAGMFRAEMPGELIYAYSKAGVLVSDENQHLAS